jgi:hypothetical protein
MNKNKILLGLGIVTFIIGFIILSFVAWWLNLAAGNEDVFWETARRGILTNGAYTLIGLALVTIGMIFAILSKFER